MRKLLIFGAIVVIAVAVRFIGWRPAPKMYSIVGDAATANAAQSETGVSGVPLAGHGAPGTLVPGDASKHDTKYHYYNPLKDPPPHETTEQFKVWSRQYRRILFGDMLPSIGPSTLPLASSYQEETVKAMHGDVTSMMTLFKGLRYCTGFFLQSALGFNIRRSTFDAYCKDITPQEQGNWVYWGWQAAQAGDPIAQAVMADGNVPMVMAGTRDVRKYRAILRKMNDAAAHAGVVRAWDTMTGAYASGGLGYPVSRVDSYASLYTAYMLSRSPDLEMAVWRQSLYLTPLEIAEAIKRGRKNYHEIARR